MCFNIEDQLKNHDAANRCAAQLREGFPDSPEARSSSFRPRSAMVEDNAARRPTSPRARPRSAASARVSGPLAKLRAFRSSRSRPSFESSSRSSRRSKSDRFERIGVPVFVKGYLRQYGARLGLDPRDLLARYSEQTSLQEVLVQPSKTIKLHDERQITRLGDRGARDARRDRGARRVVGRRRRFDRRERPSAAPSTGGDAKPASAEPASAPANAHRGGRRLRRPSRSVMAPRRPPRRRRRPAPRLRRRRSRLPRRRRAHARSAASGLGASPSRPRLARRRLRARRCIGRAAGARTTPCRLARGPARAHVRAGELGRGHRRARRAPLLRPRRRREGRAEMRGEPPFAVVLGNAGGVKIVVDGEDFASPDEGPAGRVRALLGQRRLGLAAPWPT